MHSAVLALLLQSTAPVAEEPVATQPNPPPAPCDTEAHKAFDFWIGQWFVYPTKGEKQVARSAISKMSGGCVVRETWMPFKQPGGTSMTMLNADTGRWEQVWIGADGQRVEFEGGIVDGKMILTAYWDNLGGSGKHALVRMTFTQQEDFSVRQFGEASTDHGLTWQPSFEFLYKRAPLPVPKEP